VRKEETLGVALQSGIERLLGAKVEAWRRVEGGYTPALRLLCQTAHGNFFVKIGTTPLTSQMLCREICNYTLIRGDFIPQLVGWEDDAVAPILIIEDLSAAHWPTVWDERKVALVLTQIDTMHNTQAPLEPFAQARPAFGSSWQAVASDPAPFLSLNLADERWLEAALPNLIAAESACSTEGTSLTHWDLRSDNMCLREGRAIFVDWNLPVCRIPNWILVFGCPVWLVKGARSPKGFCRTPRKSRHGWRDFLPRAPVCLESVMRRGCAWRNDNNWQPPCLGQYAHWNCRR